MKSKVSKQNEFDPKLGFEIKNPVWAFWVCLLAMIGCLVTYFVFLFLKTRNVIATDTFYIGYIFLVLSLLSAVGVYAWVCEKLTYSNGDYKYYRAFGKNRIAPVEEIGLVKVLIFYYHIKYGGIRSKIRIFFYDNSKNIIIKIIDDGTLSENEIFLKSLKYNRIKIIREEKYDY
ncbi:MAG: hypothetical protein IJW83_02005 [Clostridia bacterium]|nr:hypothetical protein [Clostridia bacterium]